MFPRGLMLMAENKAFSNSGFMEKIFSEIFRGRNPVSNYIILFGNLDFHNGWEQQYYITLE